MPPLYPGIGGVGMKKLHTCEDCHAVITDPAEIRAGQCSACLSRWYAATVGGATMVIDAPFHALRPSVTEEPEASCG